MSYAWGTIALAAKMTARLLLALLFLLAAAGQASAAAEQPNGAQQLLPAAGGALVSAGQKDWPQAAAELEQFAASWKALRPTASTLADGVNAALKAAQAALGNAASQPDAAYEAVSKLAKAANAYAAAGSAQNAQAAGSESKGNVAAKALLSPLQTCLDAIRGGRIDDAKEAFKRFDQGWSKAETAIRADQAAAYGAIETKISLARVPLQADPPKAEAAASAVAGLMQTIEDYANGKLAAQAQAQPSASSISGALQLLQKAQDAIRSGSYAAASEQLQQFIALWPSVESAVQTRSPDAYASIENEMTAAAGQLQSEPPQGTAAAATIAAMQRELAAIDTPVAYTAWDAALILLREGVEALLVLAALLAFLQRTGNAAKTKWVWSGAAAGLLASVLLAALLTLAIAGVAAGSTREMLEGVTGLVSVAMLLTVGAWLHGKSQAHAWQRYIEGRVGTALASGSLWSLLAVAALAILREGAETAIFYIGIAPYIAPLQLLLGIAGALAVLVLLGYAVVKGSVRLPLRPFFLTATVLIYYLVFKFLGQSVHALQVSGALPAHASPHLPAWNLLGLYPTWESTLPQLVVLAAIVFQWVRTERKARKAYAATP
jgi:high-affinity iron transporter